MEAPGKKPVKMHYMYVLSLAWFLLKRQQESHTSVTRQ
jgi:hypothetical protein